MATMGREHYDGLCIHGPGSPDRCGHPDCVGARVWSPGEEFMFGTAMTPLSGEVSIVTGHALDLIQHVEKFDLLVTDPPYAFGNQGTSEHAISATVATVLRESAHRLRKGGWAVVFAASSWRSTAYMIEATRGLLEPVRFGTWAKPEAKSKVRTPGWAWASVNVILMRKPGKDVAGVPVTALDYIVEPPLMNGRRAELPQVVADWAVWPFVQAGGLALDPFAGTGKLLKSAAAGGMAALGFDQDGAVALTSSWDTTELEAV